MSAGDLAALIVAISSVAITVIMLFAVVALLRTLRVARETLDDVRATAVPAVAELHRVAYQTNNELDRVDDLLDRADSISASVDSTTRLTYLLVSNPIIKVLAFTSGLGRAVTRLRKRS